MNNNIENALVQPFQGCERCDVYPGFAPGAMHIEALRATMNSDGKCNVVILRKVE